jgi:chemotaxis protein MotB
VAHFRQKELTDLKKCSRKIQSRIEPQKLNKNIEMTITAEGLRIEHLESDKATLFDSGSPYLKQKGQAILTLLAAQLGQVPNHLSIEGDTDAEPSSTRGTYSNWELSADRSNAARRLMQKSGLRPGQVAQVRSFADQRLRNPKDPVEASNRRVSIIVQYLAGDRAPDSPEAKVEEVVGRKAGAHETPAVEKEPASKH